MGHETTWPIAAAVRRVHLDGMFNMTAPWNRNRTFAPNRHDMMRNDGSGVE